jgi:1,4-dihydroxy-2-naphthoate octaprenyltransferase
LSAVAGGWLPPLALAAVLALAPSARAARLLLRNAAQPQQLGDAIRLTIAAMMMHGALLSLGLILG